jgi:orotate phosphoribosyltransferase
MKSVRRDVVDKERQMLRDLVETRCLLFGDFTLSTGEKSDFYFDCKHATLDGETLSHIADAFLNEIKKFRVTPTAIGGLTMGADFIAAAVAMRAFQIGAKTVHASIVRQEPKKHGTKNLIENELPSGTPIVVVDDVITTGSSTRKACVEFQKAGYRIVGILALVDREAGGLQELARAFNCDALAVFKKSDFPNLVKALRDDHGARQRVVGTS